ncbi:MAG: GNAT family N-acetyltransferase [Coriobacteriales bacterium]|jgi:hypothetical protein|nr:GNAT family N-acetyltransferase [Coriobacteriales bacterium]
MPSKLPTGEEPPKGFETLIETRSGEGLRIDCVLVSQLSHLELREVKDLRNKALARIMDAAGVMNEHIDFEDEVGLVPDKDVYDKLLFRAYYAGALVGGALVFMGYPQNGQWSIMHIIIDPDCEFGGIRSGLVDVIEQYARDSKAASTSIFAIPLVRKGMGFWEEMGYVEKTSEEPIRIAGLDHELVVYNKEL